MYNRRMTRLPNALFGGRSSDWPRSTSLRSNAQAPPDRLKQVVQPYVDAQMFMGSVLGLRRRGHFQQELWYGRLGVERSKFFHDSIQHRVDDQAIHRSFNPCSLRIAES